MINLNLVSLVFAIIFLLLFISFCLSSGIFHRFGKKNLALNNKEMISLIISGFLPGIGFFISFIIGEKYNFEIVQFVIYNTILLIIIKKINKKLVKNFNIIN